MCLGDLAVLTCTVLWRCRVHVHVPVAHAALLVGSEVNWLWRDTSVSLGIAVYANFGARYYFQHNCCFRQQFQ